MPPSRSAASASYDQALDSFATAPTTELSELVTDTMYRKGLALMQNQNPSEATVVFDAVVAKFSSADAKSVVYKVTNALLYKATALLLQGKQLLRATSPCCLAVWAKKENSARVSARR